MNWGSFRVRMTLWNLGVLSLVLVSFGGALWFSVRAMLQSNIDRVLADRARLARFGWRGPGMPELRGGGPPAEGVGARPMSPLVYPAPPPGEPGLAPGQRGENFPEHPRSPERDGFQGRWRDEHRTRTRGGPEREAEYPPREYRRGPRREPPRPGPPVRFFQLNGEPRGPGPTLPPWDPAVISRAALGFEVFSTAATEEGIFRVYSFPVGPPGPPEAVAQTAVPLNEQHRLLTSLARTLLLLIPLALAAAGVGGAFLASRAIAPVQALKRATLELGEGDLSRRIEVSGRDEFADLAVTFNAMAARLSSAFSRLESAYEQQRRFAGDASHELRTPLTTLKANTSLALSLKPDLDAYREALEAADAAADVMNRIVQDLLLLARSDDGRLQMDLQLLDIDTVLRDAARATSRPELAPVLVQTRTEGALVAGDPLHLRRLFTNLLENALRHTPAAGTVRLAARALDQPVPTGGAASTALACPAPAVGTVPPVPASTPEPASSGISIEVRVEDTGEGIAAEHLPHLFERFYRGDAARSHTGHNAGGGTGLGLSICETIVLAHRGAIYVDSKLGKGTTVRVLLPAYEAAVSPAPAHGGGGTPDAG